VHVALKYEEGIVRLSRCRSSRRWTSVSKISTRNTETRFSSNNQCFKCILFICRWPHIPYACSGV